MASEPASPLIQFLRRIAGPPPDRDLADRQLLERFVTARDQAAFAALVQRHGPMVLGVCRRLLHDAHEAEDAFQATFLVLAHKARSIGRPELLGPWLHGVAYRTAARARQAARRRARGREAGAMPDGDPAVEVAWRELRQVLDEELGRLAQKYRAPLVLFYLEGKTTEEVARQLGCPQGTVLSRLARGRDRLRHRLVRRGLALSAGVMAGVLAEKAAAAAVPAALALGTVKAAALTAAGQAATGAIPATVAALTRGELRAMLLSKLKVVAAVALAVTVAAAGTVVWVRPTLADKPAAAVKEEAPKDEDKIVGTWAYVSVETGGQKVPEEQVKDAKMIFAADGKFTAIRKGKEIAGTYKLDPAKKPKEITTANDDGKTHLGIYKLDGDALTVCLTGEDGAERPTGFATKEGSKVVLVVLKREKDEKAIAGTWAIVSAERGGQKVPEEAFKGGKWTFAADGKVTARFRPDKDLGGTYKLDPAKKPKEITITTDDGKTQPSIYKLDGDTLTICMGDSDVAKERPTEFATKEGTKVILFVLKREEK
jgi:RNA polymerase sigma factor (sigma-70 family)